MVILIFNNQLLDDCTTSLEIDELRASHDTHQNQSRMGLHEEIPCLQQEIGDVAVQLYQDTGTRVPPYLERKLLMRYDETDQTSQTNCNCDCRASEGKMAILGDSETSTVSDDGDWIHSDYSYEDVDEDEAQRHLGVGEGPSRNGEFPPRVRWLRRRHLHRLMKRRMAAMKCVHWRHGHDGKVTQIQVSPFSEKRKRKDTEASEWYDRNGNDDLDDESTTRKRQRHGSCHGSDPDIIQRVEGGLGGLPANTDGTCEVVAPPIPISGPLSEASALSVAVAMGLRRSQRIRKKLGSASGASPSRRS